MDAIPKATPNTKGWSGELNSPGLGEITNLCIDGIASAKKAAEEAAQAAAAVLPLNTDADKGKTLGLGEKGPEWAIPQDMAPSSKSVGVALPPTGGYVVAPANGYYTAYGYTSGATASVSGMIILVNATCSIRAMSNNFGQSELGVCIPVKKGDTVYAYYVNLGNTPQPFSFRFIYSVSAARSL